MSQRRCILYDVDYVPRGDSQKKEPSFCRRKVRVKHLLCTGSSSRRATSTVKYVPTTSTEPIAVVLDMCRPHLPKHHEDAASSPHTNGLTSWLMAVNSCLRGSLHRFSAPSLSIELVQSLALPWYCLVTHLWLAAGANSTLQHTRNGVDWNGVSLL